MSYPTATPSEASRHAVAVAGAITFAVRACRFYAEDHPAVDVALDRIIKAIGDATVNGAFVLTVTPQTLLVGGASVEATRVIADCARMLHEMDIVQLSFIQSPSQYAARRLLSTLTLAHAERRARGGPAAIWQAEGEPSVLIEQIDYQELLEREAEHTPARRDAGWQTIVQSIVARRRTFSESEQQRLLEISRDARAIGELAEECRSAYCTPDGSPLLSTQATAIANMYRHIGATVTVLEPERDGEVLHHFAAATSFLEPTLAMEVLRSPDAPNDPQRLMTALRRTFDNRQLAMLIARALTSAGAATTRLSVMLDTVAPSQERRQEILRLADTLLAEREFVSQTPVEELRKSLEALALAYNAAEPTPETPRTAAATAAAPAPTPDAAEPGAADLPPELDGWLATLQDDSVREYSGQLLIDLLTIETHLQRAAEIAQDMSTFAQDSIAAGAYREATRIVAALVDARSRPQTAREACASAISAIGRSPAMVDSISLLGELTDDVARDVAQLCVAIGPPAVPSVVSGFASENGGRQSERALKILINLGPPAIPEMGQRIEEQEWWVQRDLAKALGMIGTPMAVTPLQSLLRRGDARVISEVVPALSAISDPAAARALGIVLRAASGEARMTVVSALVAAQDARAVPMLARILDECEPFGKDYELVLQTLDTVAAFPDDRAVKSVATVARKWSWLAPRRSRHLRERATSTLARIGTRAATASLETLAKIGDRQLRRLAAAAKAAADKR